MLEMLANPLDLLKSIGFDGILAFWHSCFCDCATRELHAVASADQLPALVVPG